MVAKFKLTTGRSTLLLVALVGLLLVYPFVEALVLVRSLLDLTFTLVMLSALYTVTANRLVFGAASGLTVVALSGRWVPFVFPNVTVPFLVYIPSLAVFAFAAVMILAQTLRAKHITLEQIAGALAVYLLIGLIWAHGYLLLETVRPGSLALGISSAAPEQARFGACVYFSYVTLTTLGYGDIAPVSGQARSLAMTEAILGQLYLAALIARLVGIHVASGGGPIGRQG